MKQMDESTPLHKMTKDQLKSLALKDRIGEITSKYEDELADLRAEATQRLGAMSDMLKTQEAELEALQTQLKKYQETENDVQVKEDGNKKSAK
jgi:hypothetical protein